MTSVAVLGSSPTAFVFLDSLARLCGVSSSHKCSKATPIVVFTLGTTSVYFSEGAVDTTARRRLSTIGGSSMGTGRKFSQKGLRAPRRRLSSVESSTTSSVSVSSISFNVNGSPSDMVEGGVTSIRLASTDDGRVRIWQLCDVLTYGFAQTRRCRYIRLWGFNVEAPRPGE